MSITAKLSRFQHRLAALLSLLVVGLLAWPVNVRAVEDPQGCSLSGGGQGNTGVGGINFSLTFAHVGDVVPLFPSLGMVNGACRSINTTGSIWIATGRLTNFLVNVTLEPGNLVTCPANGLCEPGPYNVTLTPDLVGAGVSSPNGSVIGVPRTVRAVQNGQGTVLTGDAAELLMDFHTTTIGIVRPCIEVVKLCAYPAEAECFPAGAPINFTGYVTNCGDIRLTNVTIVDSRTPLLFSATPPHLPLFQPLSLDRGEVVSFQGSFTPTLAEICAGSATNTITVRGTDITTIGGPNASVTNSTTVSCNICVNPCLTVTKVCAPAIFGQPQTVSGVVTNCGDIAITNIVITDDIYGSITTIAALAPGQGTTYSQTFTATRCGTTTNIVTAAGFTACGASIQARATNTCFVDCPPCIAVTKLVACFDTNDICGPFGKTATGVRGDTQLPAFCYSITISNCGAIALTNVTVVDDKLGDLTTGFFASPVTAFPVGGTITFITNRVSLAVDTTNTVTATGQSALTGQTVTNADKAAATAIALVLQASVSCSMSVTSPDDLDGNPNDAHVSILGSGSHNVTFTITATAGSVPLANVTISSPTLASLGCSLPQVIPLLGANQSTNFTCTVLVNCANIPAGGLTNIAEITAQIDTSTGLCAHDATGVSIRVASTNSDLPCAVVIQCTPPSCLGDFVWEDLNRNGIQDAGESGISNVVVRLLPCTGTNVLATATTSSNGLYLFCDLAPGAYRVEALLPNGYLITLPNVGTNDCVDSDLDATTRIH